MVAATLTIDIGTIAANARRIAAMAAARGVRLFGVTKAVAGMPQIARAMLEGGFAGLGESRLENARRLRRAGIAEPIMMLRIPPVSDADAVVQLTDISLNSELGTLRALSAAALRAGRVHDVILMVELGDLREGMSPTELLEASDRAMDLSGLRLVGLGANLLCASGVVPTADKMRELCDLAQAVEARHGIRLSHISGGNSSCLSLLAEGVLPERINALRVGYSVLLGRNGADGSPLPDLRQDAFTIEGELIERKRKPSLPSGTLGLDAFGNKPVFVDRGERLRGIVSLGRLDLDPRSLIPKQGGIEIVTASSDHLILDVTDAGPVEVGDKIEFLLDYASLVQAIMSPYVVKRLAGQLTPSRPKAVDLIGPVPLLEAMRAAGLLEELRDLGLDASRAELGTEDVAQAVRAGCSAALARGAIPVLVDTDRAEVMPALEQLAATGGPLGLIWLDSRPCCEPPGSDPENDALRQALTGQGEGQAPPANAETTALVGLRRASAEAIRFLRRQEVRAFTMEDVDEIGIREVMRRSLVAASDGTQGCVLVMHASVADNGFAQGMRHAGLSYRECSQAMEMVAASGALRAVLLTGVPADATPEALEVSLDYLLSTLGRRILGGFAAESDALLR